MDRIVDQTADRERGVLKNTNSHAQQPHCKSRDTDDKRWISEWYTLYTQHFIYSRVKSLFPNGHF